MKRFQRILLPGLCLFLCLLSCKREGSMLPASGGRPYEVLVVGDRDSTVTRALGTDVAGLPRPEPSFDVSTCDSAHFKSGLRLARAIVIVTINPEATTDLRMRYEKNVWAQPQTIVYIMARNAGKLKAQMPQQTHALCNLLTREELNAELTRLKRHRNMAMERKVEQLTGLQLMIPEEMTAAKTGRDFLWMSNNGTQAMVSIILYKARRTSSFIAARDSALGKNIRGETDAMRMATVPGTVTAQQETLRGRRVTVYRGLWQMEGDAMGGAFVARRIGNWVAEAFVYAPGMQERNMMRRMEAALMSGQADRRRHRTTYNEHDS